MENFDQTNPGTTVGSLNGGGVSSRFQCRDHCGFLRFVGATVLAMISDFCGLFVQLPFATKTFPEP
jgi:hypothetical protein